MSHRKILYLLSVSVTFLLALPVRSSPYMATATKLPPIVTLSPHSSPPNGYIINFFNLAQISSGGALIGRSVYSEYPACVAAAPGKSGFLILTRATLGHGTEMYKCKVRPWEIIRIRKFRWTPFIRRYGPPCIMVGRDGYIWIWSASEAKNRVELRVLDPHLRRQSGDYELPSNKYVEINSIIVGNQAVVFTTRSVHLRNHNLIIVQRNGQANMVGPANAAGWPQYLSVTGDFVSGMTQGGKLICFSLFPGGKIVGARTLQVIATPKHTYPVVAYAALDQKTGFCETQVQHGEIYGFHLERFSLKTGKIEKTIALPARVGAIFASGGHVFLITDSGRVVAYSPKLRPVGHLPSPTGFLRSFAVSSFH